MKLLSDNHLFWDTDVNSIDPKVHKQAIIERVLERGSWDYIKELISYYGRPQIIEAAQKARWFSDKTMHFISGYFNIPLSKMRCYIEKQSNPIHYL
jgi:hypothetical protein